MKSLLLLSVGLFCAFGFSQESWDYLPTQLHSNHHGALYTENENSVHVVTDGGYFYKTGDGGLNWTEYSSEVNENFYDLVLNSNIGFAVGDNGSILKTSNAGETWTSLSSGTSENLYSISINSSSSVWTVGDNGTVLHSPDNGLQWEPIDILTTNRLNSIRFKNENEGYIGGNDGSLYFTQNAGATWELMDIPTDFDLFSISFAEDYIYLMAGEVSTYYDETIHSGFQIFSSNNNIDWNSFDLEPMEFGPADFSFSSPTTGYTINSAAMLCDCCYVKIEKTIDGGQSWEYSLNEETDSASCNANSGYADIEFASEQVGYVLLGSQILKTPYQNTAGINDFRMEQTFIVYPNPSNTSQFNIKISANNLEGLSLEIIDFNGKSIFKADKLKEENSFTLSSISEGIYFVNLLKNEKKLSSQKLIVKL